MRDTGNQPVTNIPFWMSWARWIGTNILTCGPIPSHVAFIMDGNRRFARKKHINVVDGHTHGFETLTDILRICLEIGITTVSVYAFSIENFKRPDDEVRALMNLAREKLIELHESGFLKKHNVSVRVLGNISMLPSDVQSAIAVCVSESSAHTRAVLNICFAYTSREEMAHSMQTLASAVEQEKIEASDINEDFFSSCLYAEDIPDLLIRTSGETRLSDFLLWQCSTSILEFLDVLWPDFSFQHIFGAILLYQHYHTALTNLHVQLCESADETTTTKVKQQIEAFKTSLQAEKSAYFTKLAYQSPGLKI